MADAGIRELERQWKESGTAEAHQRYIQGLERAGVPPTGPLDGCRCRAERDVAAGRFHELVPSSGRLAWMPEPCTLEVLGPDLDSLCRFRVGFPSLYNAATSSDLIALCSSRRLEVWSQSGEAVFGADADAVEGFEESACCLQGDHAWWLRGLDVGSVEVLIVSLSTGHAIVRETVDLGAGEIFSLHPHPDGRVLVRALEPGPEEVAFVWAGFSEGVLRHEEARFPGEPWHHFLGFAPSGKVVLCQRDHDIEARSASGKPLQSFDSDAMFDGHDGFDVIYTGAFLDDHWCVLRTGEGWLYLVDLQCASYPPRRLVLPGVEITRSRYRVGLDEFHEGEHTDVNHVVALDSKTFATLETSRSGGKLRTWSIEID